MKKRIITSILTLCLFVCLITNTVFATTFKYTEVDGLSTLVKDAEVHVYQSKNGGTVELTNSNNFDDTFPQGIGFRQYSAYPADGWVFKDWTYEQLYEGKDLGNRSDWIFGDRYSFSNRSNNWYDAYDGGDTISVNRLTTIFETIGNPIIYNLYANFNPTITSQCKKEGSIYPSGVTEVAYGANQSFEIIASPGYTIASIGVDDVNVINGIGETSYTYTFENVDKPRTISVEFDEVEDKYSVTYTDGVDDEDIFIDQVTNDILSGTKTPTFQGTPTRSGYVFKGWSPEINDTVTENTIYTATWAIDANGNGVDDNLEDKYSVTYTDGVDDEDIFIDQVTNDILSGTKTPAFQGTPTRSGYVFKGWSPEISDTVTENTIYTATWDDINTDEILPNDNSNDHNSSNDTNTNTPDTGDTTNLGLYTSILIISGIVAITLISKRRKESHSLSD